MTSSKPLFGQTSCSLQWAVSRTELWNRVLLCPQIRWIWLWMWTALVECACLMARPDPGLASVLEDKHSAALAVLWSPMDAHTSVCLCRRSLGRFVPELWYISKLSCTPAILSILESSSVILSIMMWRQLQLPLQKGFLSANKPVISYILYLILDSQGGV